MNGLPLLRAATVTAALLAAVLVPLSAYLRHAEMAPAAQQQATRPVVNAARSVHRLVASTLALVALALNIGAWLGRGPPRGPAAVLLATAGGLAVLGVVAGGSRSPPVVLAHLAGGMLTAAAALWLALACNTSRRAPSPRRPLTAAAFGTAGTVVLGGLAATVEWSPMVAVHGAFGAGVASVILTAAVGGLVVDRPSAGEWRALALLAAVCLTGWWNARVGTTTVAATTHNAAVMLMVLEITRWLHDKRRRSAG